VNTNIPPQVLPLAGEDEMSFILFPNDKHSLDRVFLDIINSHSQEETMKEIDYRKEFKKFISPKVGKVETVTLPAMNFLMIDGKGDPNTSAAYQDAVGALYSAAYTLKFMFKKELEINYNVMALEGLWWVPDMDLFSVEDKDAWLWTMMLFTPDFVTQAHFIRAVEVLKVKKPNPALGSLRLETSEEGICAQVMHIGPYAAEKPTVDLLHGYIHENGYQLTGKHHEIYMGDPRKAAPEKLKTIIRQPMKKE
jgi:hypothetical protein